MGTSGSSTISPRTTRNLNDLAGRMPDKLREMQEIFFVEATKYNVFSWTIRSFRGVIAPRPSATAGRTVFNYSGEMPGIPTSDAPSILNRSYTITAEVEIPQGGAQGMLVTLGGRFGGYGLYLLNSRPVFTYNFVDLERFRWEGQQPLTPGKHTIAFEFTYDGPGFGKGGTGALKVDGREVAARKIPHTIAIIMSIDETFDVGMDSRTPVDDKDMERRSASPASLPSSPSSSGRSSSRARIIRSFGTLSPPRMTE